MAIAGKLVNRRSVFMKNFEESAPNPLMHIHANPQKPPTLPPDF
jgi:hypothetical protein